MIRLFAELFGHYPDAVETGEIFSHGGFADAAARQQESGTRQRYADWNGPRQ